MLMAMASTVRIGQVVLVVMLLLMVFVAPAVAQSGFLDAPRLDFGLFDFGVSVASRRPGASIGGVNETTTSLYRLADTEIVTTDIGLDIRLRWPFPTGATEPSPLQPYVSLGPALAVPLGEDALAISRQPVRTEPATALGVRGALGLTWLLSPDASIFGEYRRIQDRGSASRAAEADFFYGLNLRF
jgi:hypothetical protein